ncbi:MAG: GNAT family N-acetyltransferase [Candidatus Sericytochromatia bacterium]|uniref:GNAT family N-acetyltransferase n=1 Tax=Candidatus Tanganyikabacteria bacterium TaxID=2961651 RepID=A0A937X3X3_9BACT|nr:GNAT family N-acetyltransferase [Candidatus Tanganyikabacteria bacterium]
MPKQAMQSVTFEPVDPSEPDSLAAWLASDTRPCHGVSSLDLEAARHRVRDGFLDDALAFWMLVGSERIGLFRLHDLSDPTPGLDIRIRTAWRGQGLGKVGLRWVTDYVFKKLPDKIRVEGNTRVDNVGMRRVFEACGYVKEAHFRRAWPGADGVNYDCTAYGILREDWEAGSITPVAWDS